MSSSHFYGGVPIENVDFEKEYNTELEALKRHINDLEQRKLEKGDKFNYRFWALKLNRSNRALERGAVSLDEC